LQGLEENSRRARRLCVTRHRFALRNDYDRRHTNAIVVRKLIVHTINAFCGSRVEDGVPTRRIRSTDDFNVRNTWAGENLFCFRPLGAYSVRRFGPVDDARRRPL